jgi:maltodextrin utilization protein YvdJ
MKIKIKFKWQDMWIGAYWENYLGLKSVYLCIIPMLPIKITFNKESKYSLDDIRRMMDED